MLTRITPVLAASALCVLIAASSGCSRGALSGIFVEHDEPGEVAMIRLVESPPGHLAGSLVVSALNIDGSRKTDAVSDVSGTMTGSNISLQLNRSIAGWSQFLGSPTNLVGTLNGGVLTLNFGNQTLRFREMNQQKYESMLGEMTTLGNHFETLAQAAKSVRDSWSEGQQLNAKLKNYISWGQQKIDRVATLHQWYADRIKRYSKCLQTIRPFAAAKVASWRWQDCVLTIENDKYDRDQMTESVRDADTQNTLTAKSLDSKIALAQEKFPQSVDALNSACPYSKNANQCFDSVRQLKSYAPNGALDANLITQFRAIVPKVNTAIAADVQTSANGESRLSTLAQEVERVYRSAQ